MQPGYYLDIPIDDYHQGEGVSKSTLDLIRRAPALVQWSKNAPRSEDTAAVDLGDAFHAVMLEPFRFPDQYIVAPECDRRTTEGKNDYRHFMRSKGDRHALTGEQGVQLSLMRRSVLAHPTAKRLLSLPGDIEPSIYWIDPITGLLCRIRPDKLIRSEGLIVDLKTTADMENFGLSIKDYRYYVQDPFYTEGYTQHFGEPPRGFIFIVCSTTKSAGRYPVRVFVLKDEERSDGETEYREDLNSYAECVRTGNFPGIEPIGIPGWKKKRD